MRPRFRALDENSPVNDDIRGVKWCRTCLQWEPVEAFGVNSFHIDGLTNSCEASIRGQFAPSPQPEPDQEENDAMAEQQQLRQDNQPTAAAA